MISDVRKRVQKERICLRMWVFKFVEYEDGESFEVCVEGYRPNDRTETILRNWYSTAIQERISSSLLVSRSGSIYELRGSIDKDLAYHYGYPAELVDIFANGFPEDWYNILGKYFLTAKTASMINKSYRHGFFAIRRSLHVERGRDVITCESNNITSQESTRLSIAPPPVASPDIVSKEVQIQGKENCSHGFVPNNAEDHITPTTQKKKNSFSGSRRNSSVIVEENHQNSTKSTSVNRTSEGIPTKDTKGIHTTSSPQISNLFVHRRKDVSLPIVQSPTSASSQSLNRDLSAGPLYEEPDSSDEASRQYNTTKEPKSREVVSHPTILPKFCDGSKVSAIPHSTLGRADDAIELTEWSIRFAPIGYGNLTLGFPKFVVLGKKEGHLTQWQTSIVTRVESAQIFYTLSTKYRLVGNINILDSATAGFPKQFVAKFIHGFPPDWRTTITELYERFIWHLETNGDFSYTREDDNTSPTNITALSQNLRCSYYESKLNPTMVKNSAKHCGPDVITYKTLQKSQESDVRRSRSGRCIRPPLAECAGQRVRYDGYGNVIGVENVTNDTVHSRTAINVSDISDYYGLSSSKRSKPSKSSQEVEKISNIQCPTKPVRNVADVNCSYPKTEVEKRMVSKRTMSSFGRYSSRSKAQQNVQIHKELEDSVSFDSEEELRIKRRIILNKARELQKEQERLLDLERRLADKEKRKKDWSTECSLPQQFKKVLREHSRDRRKRWNRNNFNGYHDDERYYLKLKQEREHLEKEWVKQNEELSVSNNEDSEWRAPVRKKRKVTSKRKKAKLSSPDTSSSSLSKCERIGDEVNLRRDDTRNAHVKSSVKKEKSWTKAELQRLKLALAAIHVCTEDDWEKISRSLGSKRDPESCKQAATKRLKWKPTDSMLNHTPQITSQLVTARAGTISHNHQTNEYTRKFMMSGGVQGEDYFVHNTTTISNSIPDVTNFCADDSLLNVINTPEEAAVNRRANIRGQFLPEAIDDGSPGSSASSEIHVVTPVDSAQRERQARYCHLLLNKGGRMKNTYCKNYSRTGDSSRFGRNREEEHTKDLGTFENLREGLENVAKMTKKASRRNRYVAESDSDLEWGDDNSRDLQDD